MKLNSFKEFITNGVITNDFPNFHHFTISTIDLISSLILTLLIVKLFSSKLLNIAKLEHLNKRLTSNKKELETIFKYAKDAYSDIGKDKLFFISTTLENTKVIITIKDNAGGIPQNVLPYIYEPYFTTKHQSKGTGLGLHMTYNMIVEVTIELPLT